MQCENNDLWIPFENCLFGPLPCWATKGYMALILTCCLIGGCDGYDEIVQKRIFHKSFERKTESDIKSSQDSLWEREIGTAQSHVQRSLPKDAVITDYCIYMYIPSLKLTVRTRKWMVGRLISFWETVFSGAMLVSGSVLYISKLTCLSMEKMVIMFLHHHLQRQDRLWPREVALINGCDRMRVKT